MVSLKFHCQEEIEDFIELDSFNKKGIIITINAECQNISVDLDKQTAIKFSKELRKQIALID